MKLLKTSPDLERKLDDCMVGRPFISKRRKFGCSTWMLNGHLLAGVMADQLIFRLPEHAVGTAAQRIPDLKPVADVRGKRLRGYAALPGSAFDRGAVADLLWLSLAYVEQLPIRSPMVRK